MTLAEFRVWEGFPPRALKWAIQKFPMQNDVLYTLFESDSRAWPPKKSYLNILKANKDEYWQFLKDNKITPNLYDKSIGAYQTWLQERAK